MKNNFFKTGILLSAMVILMCGASFAKADLSRPSSIVIPAPPANQGNLVIVKNTLYGDGTFNFTIDGPSKTEATITTSGGKGSIIIPVNATTNDNKYSVAELIPDGWMLGNIPTATGGVVATASGIVVLSGGTTTVTFTNTWIGNTPNVPPNTRDDSSYTSILIASFMAALVGGLWITRFFLI